MVINSPTLRDSECGTQVRGTVPKTIAVHRMRLKMQRTFGYSVQRLTPYRAAAFTGRRMYLQVCVTRVPPEPPQLEPFIREAKKSATCA